LDDSCLKYRGELLHVETHYGWGWKYPETKKENITNLDMQPIENFHFRLSEFSEFKDDYRRGGFGKIEDSNCAYNNYLIEFSTRHSGVYNFSENCPECNIFIFQDLESKSDAIWGFGKISSND